MRSQNRIQFVHAGPFCACYTAPMFDDAFLDQLKQVRHHRERWLTPAGIALRQKLIPALRNESWAKLLVGFPYVNEVAGGRDLRQVDLSGEDLSSAKLAGADLGGANLAGCILDQSDFSGANMGAANLSAAHCHDAHFSGTVIYGTDFRRGDFSRSRFSELKISAGLFDEAILVSCSFAGSQLQSVGMTKATLDHANFSSCTTYNFDLTEARARGANFSRANLERANLARGDFTNADFTLARMCHCSLFNGTLESAQLVTADLIGADLGYARLGRADLTGADLTNAQLPKAQLLAATMDGSIARSANLSEANLTGASLRGVDLRHALLVGADLSGATISQCAVYGVSAWDVKSATAIIADLVITADYQPTLTIDDLELAQFIHMITNNEKVAQAVDVMRTKVVLILGSFDDSTKPTLDDMKRVLRRKNLVPMVFDFEKPASQRLIETVRTLALLSAFVVVDLSRPAGQLVELGIVGDTRVPFATVMVKDTVPTAMLKALGDYYWYRSEPFEYPPAPSEAAIDNVMTTGVLPWTRDVWKKLQAP